MSKLTINAFKYAAIVAFGGFIFGLDAALISGTIGHLTTQFSLNDIEVGAVVSAPGFGVLAALLFTGVICDKIGRKKTLLVIAALYLISAITSTIAPSFVTLVVARLLGGLAFTSLSLASMYIGEMAPAKMRGKLVSMNQLTIVVGLSAAYFSNYLIQQLAQTPPAWMLNLGFQDNVWRWMLGVEIVPALLWLLLLMHIPESQRWLILNQREVEARSVLSKLYPPSEIDAQVAEIKRSDTKMAKQKSVLEQLKDLFSSKYRLALTVGVTIAIVQPVTGINAIMFYAPTVFEQVGIGTDAAFWQSVIVGLISIVATILALLTIDRFGRRFIVISGLAACAGSLLLCSYGFSHASYYLDRADVLSLQESHKQSDLMALSDITDIKFETDVTFKQALRDTVGVSQAKKIEATAIQAAIEINVALVLFGLLAFIAAFQYSIGPVMWVVFSEIVPIQLRGIAIPFFAFWTSLVSWFVQQFFPWQLTVMGVSQVMMFYSCLVIIGLVALYKLLPETKNKTIEQIESELVR